MSFLFGDGLCLGDMLVFSGGVSKSMFSKHPKKMDGCMTTTILKLGAPSAQFQGRRLVDFLLVLGLTYPTYGGMSMQVIIDRFVGLQFISDLGGKNNLLEIRVTLPETDIAPKNDGFQ